MPDNCRESIVTMVMKSFKDMEETLEFLRVLFTGAIADMSGSAVKVELLYDKWDFGFNCTVYGQKVYTPSYGPEHISNGEQNLFRMNNLYREANLVVTFAQRLALDELGRQPLKEIAEYSPDKQP